MMRILFSCLSLFTVGYGQSFFSKTFGGDRFDRGMYISSTRDQGYIVCGYSNSFSSSNDMFLVKLDAQGNRLWQKSYGGRKTEIGWSVHELPGNGYLLHGSTASKDTTNDDIYLLRLDETGNIIWEKTYGNQFNERTTSLLQTSDGNYLLIGQRTLADKMNIDSYILKLDTSGAIIWEKTFGGPFPERTFYGAETRQGDFIVSGLILPYGTNKADILLLKISKEGALLWSRTYGEKEVHDIAHSFNRNRDNTGYTITGYSESTDAGFHDGLFMQVDEEGKLLTNQRYHTGEDIRLMHAEETADHGFVVTGYARKDIRKDISDALLLKFDKKGKLEWRQSFGTPELDDQGYWVICNSDGGFTFTGYTYSESRAGDLWVIRTNAKGELK